MSKQSAILDRLRLEFERQPQSIPELSRKYSIPEGLILEHLRGKGIAKVRTDCWDRVLQRIRDWGMITLRVRNDAGIAEATVISERLRRNERDLVAEQGGARLSIRWSSIAGIYFLEEVPGLELTVSFCNKRGRCIFEVCVPKLGTALEKFRQARDTTCIGYLEGPTPVEEVRS